jgi:hypothetical protein
LDHAVYIRLLMGSQAQFVAYIQALVGRIFRMPRIFSRSQRHHCLGKNLMNTRRAAGVCFSLTVGNEQFARYQPDYVLLE